MATVMTLALTTLLIWRVLVQSGRHRAVSLVSARISWSIALLALILVWTHFVSYGMELLAAQPEPPVGLAATLVGFVEVDAIARYFETFATPEMSTPAVRFWLFEIRWLCIAAVFWMALETGRLGMRWFQRLGWAVLAFMGTLGGAVGAFLPMVPKETKPAQPTVAHIIVMMALFMVVRVNTELNNPPAWLNVQIVLLFVLAALPLKQNGHRLNAVVALLAIGCFAVADHIESLIVALTASPTGFSDLFQAAFANDILTGTVTAEIALITLAASVFVYSRTRNPLTVVAYLTLALIAGTGAALIALPVWREARALGWQLPERLRAGHLPAAS